MKHPPRTMLQLHATPEFIAAVKRLADRDMMSMSSLVRQVLLNHLRMKGIDVAVPRIDSVPSPNAMTVTDALRVGLTTRRTGNG